MNKRIEYLDYAKGIAILLMVMGHVLAWFYRDGAGVYVYDIEQLTNVKRGGVVWQLIYSFHMPLFFLISGFLTYKPYAIKDFREFFIKKSKRLLLPWVCTIPLTLGKEHFGYWFLLSLFQLSLLGFFFILVMERVNPQKKIWKDIVITFLLFLIARHSKVESIEIETIQICKFVSYVLPFCMGVILRRHIDTYHKLINNGMLYTLCVLSFIAFFGSRYFINDNIFASIAYKYSNNVLPLTGIFVVLFQCSQMKQKWLTTVLSYIGKRTMAIYILNFLFAIRIYCIGDFILSLSSETSISMQILLSFLISILIIGLSLMLYKLLKPSRLISKCIFGEW